MKITIFVISMMIAPLVLFPLYMMFMASQSIYDEFILTFKSYLWVAGAAYILYFIGVLLLQDCFKH